MKLANIRASRARAERLVGSSPTSGTISFYDQDGFYKK